ncbi:porin [Pseudoduganella namucuonensis]|uniref:Outer membrane protein (Porin) n=1 Tax=Pseudoduganella namucuonensis TaxID=1035707 RepID=A0A1I7L783_9BURK|nr:porin [Pseudoduganella namucuonensis]SFV05498.1 Outer membrane protein (porin) [Pseudoduganella namucuonensis]
MKKATLCAALATIGGLAAHPAMAQSQVTVYGILDSGLVYTNNSNAAGDSVVKVPGLTGSVPSRLGFRGAEDLGGGLQAVFVLESGVNVDTGTMGQGNRLFGRQAYVGLKSAYGTLTLGRQINMTFLAAVKSDVMGPNLFSMSSIDLYIPNARSDNAIGYLGAFNDFTVGATYSLGRDASAAGGPAATGCAGEVAGDAKACRQVTGLLGYDNKAWGVTASYDILYGNTGAAAGLTTSGSSDKRVTLNGYTMLGATKIGLGLMDRKKVAATRANDLESDMYYVGASHPLSPALTLDGQVARHDVKGSANDSTLTVVRLTYNLSKRTAVYSSLGHMRNGGLAAIALDAGGTVGAGLNQSGVSAGVRHAF